MSTSVIRVRIKDRFPFLRYMRAYQLATKRLEMHRNAARRNELFRQLVQQSRTRHCLQISVRRQKYGPHWVSVDLFDTSGYIDHQYDVQALGFPDATFDVAVCNAVLEHVERPRDAIGELRRVLKPGGTVWVEVPFNQPFHPAPDDYWRVTPAGIRKWMEDFDEVEAGAFTINASSIYNGVFFTGTKPLTD